MSRNHPLPLIRRRRIQLAILAGLCALILSGTVRTSPFVADKTILHTTIPATPIDNSQALLDDASSGALIRRATRKILQDIADFSTEHPAGPVVTAVSGGERQQRAMPRPFGAIGSGEPAGYASDNPLVASESGDGGPLVWASALGFSGNAGGRRFEPATKHNAPRADNANSDNYSTEGPLSVDGEGSNVPVAYAANRPESAIEQPVTIARIAEENSAPENSLRTLLSPQTGSNDLISAPGGTGTKIAADVPEPNNLLLFVAGLIALTTLSGCRRHRRPKPTAR